MRELGPSSVLLLVWLHPSSGDPGTVDWYPGLVEAFAVRVRNHDHNIACTSRFVLPMAYRVPPGRAADSTFVATTRASQKRFESHKQSLDQKGETV